MLTILLPTRGEDRGVLGAGSIPVAMLCYHSFKNSDLPWTAIPWDINVKGSFKTKYGKISVAYFCEETLFQSVSRNNDVRCFVPYYFLRLSTKGVKGSTTHEVVKWVKLS